jgi:hypothetical protein
MNDFRQGFIDAIEEGVEKTGGFSPLERLKMKLGFSVPGGGSLSGTKRRGPARKKNWEDYDAAYVALKGAKTTRQKKAAQARLGAVDKAGLKEYGIG